MKPVPCAIKIKRCARARPFLRRLPVIRKPSSGILIYTDTDQATFAFLIDFNPWLMVNASRRKCGAESSQDTRMKSMNEIESRNTRLEPIPFGGTVQKSGHRCASPERFVKALADEIGDACVHAKRECENNTAYAPTRYVTRNGNKRKRLSVN